MRAFVWLVIVSCGAPNVAATSPTTTDTTTVPVTASATESAPAPFVEQRVTIVGADDDVPCPTEGTCVRGRLPPETVQRILHLNRPRFRFCYETALRTTPGLRGRVAVHFRIGRDGSVLTVEIEPSSTLTNAPLGTCLSDAFKKLSFPQPEGGMVDVNYPLVFTPTGS